MGCLKLYRKEANAKVAQVIFIGFRKSSHFKHGTRCVVGYRWGFNGQERDNELKGEGNSINYKARIQDTRLGRFLSVDPLAKDYPMLTPYQFASNTPVQAIDLDGLEAYYTVSGGFICQYGTDPTVKVVDNPAIVRKIYEQFPCLSPGPNAMETIRYIDPSKLDDKTRKRAETLKKEVDKKENSHVLRTTEVEIATHWSRRYNNLSIKKPSAEYYSAIYYLEIGGIKYFNYTPAIRAKGAMVSFSDRQRGASMINNLLNNVTAEIHSHGDADPKYDYEKFSDEDLNPVFTRKLYNNTGTNKNYLPGGGLNQYLTSASFQLKKHNKEDVRDDEYSKILVK
jgi:RHS repeat-associated protein